MLDGGVVREPARWRRHGDSARRPRAERERRRGARFLRAAAPPGSRPELRTGLLAGDEEVPLAEHALVVGGGPRLLTRGRVSVRSQSRGLQRRSRRRGSSPRSSSARNPRTLAGVQRDGDLLLVTVDGRQPGWSAGVTLAEAARLMRALGARDALNLDGGGSTAMTVRGELVNRPSDPAGERPVSDGVFVLP